MLIRAALFLGLLASPVCASSPIADVLCAPTDEMRMRLMADMGELRQGSGIRNPDEIVELWSRPSGDWTLVIRYASGNSCIVAMGEHWQGDSSPES